MAVFRKTLDRIDSYEQLIQNWSDIIMYQGKEMSILIEMKNNIKVEYLAVMNAIITNLREKGIKVSGNISYAKNKKKIIFDTIKKYDFLHNLNSMYEKNLEETALQGYIPIYNYKNIKDEKVMNDKISIVIKNNRWLNDMQFKSFAFNLWEIIDNVLLHADSPIGGYCIVEKDTHSPELRITIIDCGIGIAGSFNKFGYKINAYAALKECIKEGTTSKVKEGNRGYGLYFFNKLTQLNEGHSLIYSGDRCMYIDKEGNKIYKAPIWQGTIVSMRFNTNKTVNYHDILGRDYDIEDSFDSIYE